MSQDPVDDVLILNASDDFDGPTAATTNFSIGDSVHSFTTFGRGDLPTPSVVRCQYAVIASEIDPGLGN